jgi:hypothetical protein
LDRAGIQSGRRLASSRARGTGVVRATLAVAYRQEIEWGVGGLGGEAGQTTRRGRAAQRRPLGHVGGRGVLGLGYIGLVRSNVLMGFISAGTLG